MKVRKLLERKWRRRFDEFSLAVPSFVIRATRIKNIKLVTS